MYLLHNIFFPILDVESWDGGYFDAMAVHVKPTVVFGFDRSYGMNGCRGDFLLFIDTTYIDAVAFGLEAERVSSAE